MKPNFLSLIAITASAAAISISLSGPKPLTASQIDARVDAALAIREKAFCDKHAPRFAAMLTGIGAKPESWAPQTLDELFDPVANAFTAMGNQPDDTPPPPAGH